MATDAEQLAVENHPLRPGLLGLATCKRSTGSRQEGLTTALQTPNTQDTKRTPHPGLWEMPEQPSTQGKAVRERVADLAGWGRALGRMTKAGELSWILKDGWDFKRWTEGHVD